MQAANPKKDLFVVLGVSRSGTSAITRALKVFGIDLGTKLFKPGKWNPKGFWEDDDIMHQVNEKVLNQLGHQWHSVRLVDDSSLASSDLDELRKKAIDLVKERLSTYSYWGFKDPRTAKLLAFWQPLFSKLNLNENYIITLRNPLASAQSYRHLDKVDLEKGLLLWLMHLIPAIDKTHGKNRVIVSYEGMMNDPLLQLNRIKTHLNLSLPVNSAEMDIYANQFLDKKSHHYEYTDDDLRTNPAAQVAPLCVEAYGWLKKIASDEATFDDPLFLNAWSKIKKEFQAIYPIYNYVDGLIQRNEELERAIYKLHKSWFMKIFSPIRKMDFALREKRKSLKKMRLLNTST